MRVFLTGGSGFVGGHVLETLGGEFEFAALARSEGSAVKVAAFGADVVHGALEDIDAAMLEGVDAVVHGAAYVEEWGPEERYYEVNTEGTRRLLDAAREAGVKRLVHISTNAAVFDRKGQLGVDESVPYPDHRGFPYGGSKAEAEQLVLAANTEGFQTFAVRPCFVWGPRDNSILPVVLRMVNEGSFLWLNGGRARVSTTHVSNLVSAVRQALLGGEAGRAYFIADSEDTTMREFLDGLAGTAGVELPSRSLPAPMVRFTAGVLEAAWRWAGSEGPPPVTSMAAELMSRDMTVLSAAARDGLGWTPVVTRQEALAALSAAG